MNDSLNQRIEYSDEISLVDLATTFIRRRYVFYAVFIAVTLLGVAYALLAPEKYAYVSLIEVAQKDKDQPIQAVPTTIATLESRWLPEVKTVYRAKHDKQLPLNVVLSNPESTSLIHFSSEAAQTDTGIVKATHQALIENVKNHQDALIKQEQNSLVRQMASLDSVLSSLQNQQDVGEAVAAAIEKRSRLEGMSENLKGVEVLVISRQSAERISPKRSLIVILSVLLGGMMGVFMAFIAEFYVSVKKQLATIESK